MVQDCFVRLSTATPSPRVFTGKDTHSKKVTRRNVLATDERGVMSLNALRPGGIHPVNISVTIYVCENTWEDIVNRYK